jgi:hypothetical protein
LYIFNLKSGEVYLHKSKKLQAKRLSSAALEELRTNRLLEIRAWSIAKEIVLYLIFLSLLLALTYSSRNYNDYSYHQNLHNLFVKKGFHSVYNSILIIISLLSNMFILVFCFIYLYFNIKYLIKIDD